jgi:hypothetical protein
MRTLAFVLTAALLAPPVALADAPDALDLPTAVQRSRDQWIECTATAAKAQLRGDRSAEAVADAALQRCRAREQALARVLDRQLGKDGAARVLQTVRETDRANLIRAIEAARATK